MSKNSLSFDDYLPDGGNVTKNFLFSNATANNIDFEPLHEPPYDFFYNHYDECVKDISNMLSIRYGDELLNRDKREYIERDSRDEVINVLRQKKLLPIDKLIPEYLRIIYADILGLGILEPFLKDTTVTEILVASHDSIYVERNGLLELTSWRFPSVENGKGIIKKIITPLNLTLDTSHPNVDAQLPDGSRLSASCPPLRAHGEISVTIRKFAAKVEPLAYYADKYQSSSREMAHFLEAAVRSRCNIIVSGGTGSGKTTMLNSLSMAIPNNERILTAEDVLELQLQQPHVESYQQILPNIEGRGGKDMRQVIIDMLRKRPDRIIVGEVRGAEIIEMLNAMNTGHDGSLSSIHANNATDLISRAMLMILSNESTRNLSEKVIYQLLNSALDLIVQTERLEDGSRKIVTITEVVGYGRSGYDELVKQGKIKATTPCDKEHLYLQDIFVFKQTGTDVNNHVHGKFMTTGYVPRCFSKMAVRGVNFDESFFEKRVLMEV